MIEKEDVLKYLVIGGILIGLIGFLIVFQGHSTGFAIFQDDEQTEFDLGIYVNTSYNGSAIVLVGENLTGSYTSQVFDAGAEAVWNNISWSKYEPVLKSLFCVDGGGDVYKSSDGGVNWAVSKEDYGRTSATSDMFSDSDYLYILSTNGNEVWRSSNQTDFKKVYTGFNSKSPLVGDTDNNGNLYVAVSSGEVWKSNDSGLSWELKGDVNTGTNDPKGLAIDSNDYIYVVDGIGDVYKSTNEGVNWTKVNDGYGGGSGTDGMEVDSNDDLYILLNTKIYKSSDAGVSWEIINDSISPYSNSLVEILIDSNDNFFILDAVGRVFKSTDYGVSWSEVGDCNNLAGNDPRGITEFVQENGPKSLDLNPTYVEDEYGGDITSRVDELDGTDTWERVEVQSWSGLPSDAEEINSVVGYCYVLWIDSGAQIGFQVSRDGGTTWDSEICVQDAVESTFFKCDLKVNSGVDTADEINNLRMRCTHASAGSNKYYSVDWAYVDVNYNYSVSNLDFYARSCDDSACSGESWTDISDTSPQDLSLDNSTYFQYKVLFTSQDSSISPGLYNVSINYDLVNTAPSLSLVSPQDGASYGYNESLSLNFSVSDAEGNLDSCWCII